MKYRLYTRSHAGDLLKKIGSPDRIFTAEELAFLSEHENAPHFTSKNSMMEWYLSSNRMKLKAIEFVLAHMRRQGFQSVLSLGAGACVLEYMLKEAGGESLKVTATDFDAFYIKMAHQFFPEITALEFDFFKDAISDLKKKTGAGWDVALFLGSSSVMDDAQFIRLFKQLKESGVRQVIDFCAAFLSYPQMVRMALGGLKSSLMQWIHPVPSKFHAYARTRNELRSLYKAAGLRVIEEVPGLEYPYIAICE